MSISLNKNRQMSVLMEKCRLTILMEKANRFLVLIKEKHR